jgi:hypothetical protein
MTAYSPPPPVYPPSALELAERRRDLEAERERLRSADVMVRIEACLKRAQHERGKTLRALLAAMRQYEPRKAAEKQGRRK